MPRSLPPGAPRPTPKQMGELVVAGPEPGRVLLGRLSGDTREAQLRRLFGMGAQAAPPLAAPPCYGVLVVGPARSGKTTSILVPSVSEWEGPVIATSIRGDLLRETLAKREEYGWPTLIYNPANQGGYGSNTWSPLVAAMGERAWAGAQRTATALVNAAKVTDTRLSRDEPFWDDRAASYLGPVLLAAAADGPSMAPVLKWLNNEADAREEMPPRLADHPDALEEAEAVWALASERARDSIYLSARRAVGIYRDPDVMRTCLSAGPGQLPDITPDSVLGSRGDEERGIAPNTGATLYIVAPQADPDYYAPLFSALLTSLIEAAFRRAEQRSDNALSPPLLLALDEVANITPIKELPKYSATAAGAGIQLITAFQDLGQAEEIWGKEGTRTLLSNHYARLILGGTADLPTLEWAQAMLGEVERPRRSVSREGVFGRSTRQESLERQNAATVAEIRTMPQGTALLVCGSYLAAEVTLRQWKTI